MGNGFALSIEKEIHDNEYSSYVDSINEFCGTSIELITPKFNKVYEKSLNHKIKPLSKEHFSIVIDGINGLEYCDETVEFIEDEFEAANNIVCSFKNADEPFNQTQLDKARDFFQYTIEKIQNYIGDDKNYRYSIVEWEMYNQITGITLVLLK